MRAVAHRKIIVREKLKRLVSINHHVYFLLVLNALFQLYF